MNKTMDKEKMLKEYEEIPKSMEYLDFEEVYNAYFFKEAESKREWNGIPYSVKNYNGLIYQARDLDISEYSTSELRDIVNGSLLVGSSALTVGCASSFSSAYSNEKPFIMLGILGGIAGFSLASFNMLKKYLINIDRKGQREIISGGLEDYDWIIKQAHFWEGIVDSGNRLGYVYKQGDEKTIEGLASNNNISRVIKNNSQHAMFMRDYLDDWLREVRRV